MLPLFIYLQQCRRSSFASIWIYSVLYELVNKVVIQFYYPELLQETADALQAVYPGRLSVTPMKGDYGDAISKMK